ncbi:hypothetical protein BVRB_2g041140 [Beta vulgaris subsp. vulgaris]|nr:hypothetical protein BVRB_2g041140 [Beta vulgaris subsp. vulgaris]
MAAHNFFGSGLVNSRSASTSTSIVCHCHLPVKVRTVRRGEHVWKQYCGCSKWLGEEDVLLEVGEHQVLKGEEHTGGVVVFEGGGAAGVEGGRAADEEGGGATTEKGGITTVEDMFEGGGAVVEDLFEGGGATSVLAFIGVHFRVSE